MGVVSGKVNPLDLSGNEDPEDVLENYLKGLVNSRKMAENANYYAFTATPKNKTLEMFGIPCPPNADGKVEHIPFHLYSMKQAIEEGFIMDVLQNYMTYDTCFKIAKYRGQPCFRPKEGAGQDSRVRGGATRDCRKESEHHCATLHRNGYRPA